jgi:hypothetical protein
MARRIISVILGVITGIIIVSIGDAITHALHPVPQDVSHMDKQQLREYVAGIPGYILFVMFLFWLLSAFCAGFVTARVNRLVWRVPSAITGGILMLAAILNMIFIPHPIWMWIGAILFYVPLSWLGGYIAVKSSRQPVH